MGLNEVYQSLGCEVREINGGHITSQILQRARMLEAQVNVMLRVMKIE